MILSLLLQIEDFGFQSGTPQDQVRHESWFWNLKSSIWKPFVPVFFHRYQECPSNYKENATSNSSQVPN